MTTRKGLRWFAAFAFTIVSSSACVHVLSGPRVSDERKAHARSDGALFRETQGTGDPILFIPGFLGTTRYWGPTFEPLTKDHRLVFIDALGFGQSPWPDVAYTLDDHLDALHETVKQEVGTSTLTIVGHSFGALLAAYYAARHPNVHRVVLLGLPIFESKADARTRIGVLVPLARLFVLNETVAAAGCDVMCAFRPSIQKILPALMPDLRAEVAKDGALHTWESFSGTLNNVLFMEFAREPVSHLGARAVIVHAVEDEITPVERARRLAAQTGAKLIEVPGGHHDYLEAALLELQRK